MPCHFGHLNHPLVAAALSIFLAAGSSTLHRWLISERELYPHRLAAPLRLPILIERFPATVTVTATALRNICFVNFPFRLSALCTFPSTHHYRYFVHLQLDNQTPLFRVQISTSNTRLSHGRLCVFCRKLRPYLYSNCWLSEWKLITTGCDCLVTEVSRTHTLARKSNRIKVDGA